MKYLHGEPVLNTTTLVIKNCKASQATQILKGYGYTGESLRSDDDVHGCTFHMDPSINENGHFFWVVWLRNDRDIPTVVHELTHLVLGILDESGIPIRKENDEIAAYYMGYYYKVLKGLEISQ